MGFAINTNNDALSTYRNLSMVQNSLSKSLEKLSSGLRINQAGDDAAGLTIATQLGSQVSGLQQASRNAQDGLSLVQTADGALSQAQSILQRVRDLAVQAGNDSNSASARTAIQSEASSLVAELGRIGDSVNFNGTNLLDGTTPTFKFQVGADGNSQSQISVDLSGANLKAVAGSLTNGSTGVKTTVAETKTVAKFENGSGVTFTVPTALATALGSTTTVDQQAALLNANSSFASNFTAVKLAGATPAADTLVVTAKDGTTATAATSSAAVGAAASAAGKIEFTDAAKAQAAIVSLDTQITAVSGARAGIGAIENRFNNVVSTISTSVQNLTAAKSRITDVDMAQEMVNYTRANVLSQSGTAMLAQANSLPQLALKLLG